jgi:hypothetical protein
MNPSLRFFITCSVLAASLTACGDDGKTSDSNASASIGGTTASTTDDGTTTSETPTTGESTTAGTTAPMTTSPATTDASTTEPGTSVGTSTTDTTEGTSSGPSLSWEGDVWPVALAPNCDCHTQGSGGLTMTSATDSYMNLVGVASSEAPGFMRVVAGDPANSYMLAKIKGVAGDGPFMGTPSQMPLGGPPLSADNIALVEEWIAQGAQP